MDMESTAGTDSSVLDGSITSKSQSEIMAELQSQQLNVTDKVGASLTFASGAKGAMGEWAVENAAQNRVKIRCDVYLGDRLIARSPMIAPNQHIEKISLLQSIQAGEYEVTAYINYYDPSTGAYAGKAGYKLRLTVAH